MTIVYDVVGQLLGVRILFTVAFAHQVVDVADLLLVDGVVRKSRSVFLILHFKRESLWQLVDR